MPYEDGRRYPYSAPRQQHSKGSASKSQPSSDKSKDYSDTSKMKSNRQSGVEGSTGSGPKGMAKKPKGTPIAGPGGRNSRANTYGSPT